MLAPLLFLSLVAISAGYFLNDLLAGYNSKNFWNDIIFLNQDKLGRNFGCKCNQPANNNTQDNNNKPIEPA